MSTAEERFLRNREERDRARFAAKEKGTDSQIQAEQRNIVLRELEKYEKQVASAMAVKDYSSADEALRGLRRLVQDAAATGTFTAYEMARANQVVSAFHEERLRAINDYNSNLPDQAPSIITTPSSIGGPTPLSSKTEVNVGSVSPPPTSQCVSSKMPSVTGNAAVGNAAGKQRFRFSASGTLSKTEEKPNCRQNTVPENKRERETLPLVEQSSFGDDHSVTYGNAKDTTLFITSASALFLRACEGCQIFVLPIPGSAFVTGLKSCKLFIASAQLRLKDCYDVEVYAWVTSTPIIENCDNMRFGPYSCWRGLVLGPVPLPPSLAILKTTSSEKHYVSHADCINFFFEKEEVPGENNWHYVEDFQWLKKTASPHWRRLEPSEYHYSDLVFQKFPSSA